MTKHKFLIINIIFLLFPFAAWAQNDTTGLPKIWKQLGMDYIDKSKTGYSDRVMSASRSQKKIDDIPVTVYIITKEEIQRNNWVTLVDVLKHAPGIRVSQPGSGEEGETFMMRGLLGNDYAKFLVNNIPVSPSVVSGMPLGAQLPIRQAERIEIIYGPAASIYGADATCGVVNIVTKELEQSNYSDASIVYGTNEYHYLNFTVGGKAGKNKNVLRYTLYGSSYQFLDMNVKDGYESIYDPFSYYKERHAVFNFGNGPVEAENITAQMLLTRGVTPKTIYPHYYSGSINAPTIEKIGQSSNSMGLDLKIRNFGFSFQRMARQAFSSIGRTSYLFNYNDPNLYIGEVINRFNLDYQKKFDKLSINSSLSYNRYRMDNNSSHGITYDAQYTRTFKYAASDDLASDFSATYSPSEHIEILAGCTYQCSGGLPETNDRYSRFNIDDYKAFSTNALPEDSVFGNFGLNPIFIQNISVFGQTHLNYGNWNFVLGFRQDHNTKYGNSSNPRLAVMYKISPNFSLRGSYGEAFKAPSPTTMYRSSAYQIAAGSKKIAYVFIPNANLKPEKMKSYELGLKYAKGKYSFDFCAYYNILSNLIIYGIETEPLDPKKYPNSEYAQTLDLLPRYFENSSQNSYVYGLQFTGTGRNIYKPIKLDVSFSLTLSQGKENFYHSSIDLRQLPKSFVQGQLSFEPVANVAVIVDYVHSSSWLKPYLKDAEEANKDIARIRGYHTFDVSANYTFNKHFSASIKILNLFNTRYAGISATGTDTDLLYNPQTLRNVRAGLSYHF